LRPVSLGLDPLLTAASRGAAGKLNRRSCRPWISRSFLARCSLARKRWPGGHRTPMPHTLRGMGRNDQKSALNAFKKRASCTSRAVSPSQRHFRVTHNLPVVGSSPTRPTGTECSFTRRHAVRRQATRGLALARRRPSLFLSSRSTSRHMRRQAKRACCSRRTSNASSGPPLSRATSRRPPRSRVARTCASRPPPHGRRHGRAARGKRSRICRLASVVPLPTPPFSTSTQPRAAIN